MGEWLSLEQREYMDYLKTITKSLASLPVVALLNLISHMKFQTGDCKVQVGLIFLQWQSHKTTKVIWKWSRSLIRT